MPISREILDNILDLLSPIDGVILVSIFGGTGLFVDGVMFGIVSHKDRFYFKVDDDNQNDFWGVGSSPF